ncbi:MAG: CDP-glucose 4,6-dehydratase [Gemmatimonadota bacterium]|nr:CDP-glucose 4,6-dehydratase [Gemmatimonadota bacterium]
MAERAFGGVYRGKRVLITGHTGFKGSWLSLWLARLGAEVHGYSLEPPTERNLFHEAEVEACLASHRIADVRDAEMLSSAIQIAQPEFVFHLAAQSLVRQSYREPRDTYDVNVMGTVNLLEATRAVKSVRVCQIVTSDKCYENHEWVYAYRENDPMGGFDPYSSSKGCAELVVSAYRRSFFPPDLHSEHGVSLASVRAGNVIGGGDWALDRIIPDCIRALEAGDPVRVRNPYATRPWQHVLEPLSGYLCLAAEQWREPARFSDAWNFGPTGAGNLPVEQIVEMVVGAWRTDRKWEVVSLLGGTAPTAGAPLHEAGFLKLDITKSINLLGWQPVFNVTEAVDMTVDWYRERVRSGSAFTGRELCLSQINEYTQEAARTGVRWADSIPAVR